MSLLAKIQSDSLVARKARQTETATLLTTLFSEAARVGKDDGNRESTDTEVQAVIKKFIKNNDDTLKALWIPEKIDRDEVRCARRTAIMLEQGTLQSYLPHQATFDEIKRAVAELVAGLPEKTAKQMGVVMAGLNAKFGNNFDKAVASQLVKQALA